MESRTNGIYFYGCDWLSRRRRRRRQTSARADRELRDDLASSQARGQRGHAQQWPSDTCRVRRQRPHLQRQGCARMKNVISLGRSSLERAEGRVGLPIELQSEDAAAEKSSSVVDE